MTVSSLPSTTDAITARSIPLQGLTALLGAAALLQGAFYGRQLAIVLAGFVLLAAVSWARPPARIVLGFGVLFVALIASSAVNGWPAGAAKPFATLALAAAAFVVASRATRSEGAHAVLEAVCGVAALVALLGIAGVIAHRSPLALQAASAWRLASTLTYQNAAGAFFAMVLVPAAVLVCRGARIHRAAFVLIATSLVATQSRGGILGALAATGVLVVSRSVPLRRLVRPAAGACIGVAALIPSITGAPLGAVISIAGLTIAIAVAVLEPRTPRRWMRAAGALLVVTAIIVVPFTPLRARLNGSSDDRSRVWSATLAQARTHLAFGTGPGTYRLVAPKDEKVVRTEFAHNEYLQTLSETGIEGLVAVMFAIGVFALAWWRARRSDAWAATGAAGAAFLVCSALDFVWRIPLLVAVVFVVLAVSLQAQRDDDSVADRQDRA